MDILFQCGPVEAEKIYRSDTLCTVASELGQAIFLGYTSASGGKEGWRIVGDEGRELWEYEGRTKVGKVGERGQINDNELILSLERDNAQQFA